MNTSRIYNANCGEVTVEVDGVKWSETYNPRNGTWARTDAFVAAERELRRQLEKRKRQLENEASSLYPAYLAATELAQDLRLRASNTSFAPGERVDQTSAKIAGELSDSIRRQLPHPDMPSSCLTCNPASVQGA